MPKTLLKFLCRPNMINDMTKCNKRCQESGEKAITCIISVATTELSQGKTAHNHAECIRFHWLWKGLQFFYKRLNLRKKAITQRIKAATSHLGNKRSQYAWAEVQRLMKRCTGKMTFFSLARNKGCQEQKIT